MSILRKLGRNIKFLGVSTVIRFAVALLLTPFIINKVGKEPYGVYLLALTFTGYFGVLDFGMLSALVKFVAESKGANNRETLNQSVNVSFSFFFLIGLFIALMLFIASFFIGNLFHITAENMRLMRDILWISAAFAVFSWVGNVFRGVMRGFQMYHLESSINIITTLINAILTVWLLYRGYGLIGLMLATQLLNALSGLFCYLLTRREIGRLKIDIFCFLRPTFRKMFGFSFYLFLTNLFVILIFQVDYLVIGLFLNAAAITVYSIAFSIQQNIRTISPILMEPTWPLSVELEGSAHHDKQKQLLVKGTRFSTLVFVPVILISLIFAKPFINNWMGPGFEESVFPAQVLLFFWFFNAYINLGATIIIAKGFVKEIFWISAATSVTNLFLSLMLVNVLGITGVALGTTIPMVLINFPLLLRLINKKLNIGLSEFYQSTLKPNLRTYFFTAVISWCLLSVYYPKNLILTLVEMGIVYIIGLLFSYTFTLKAEEKQQLHKLILKPA